MGASRLASVLIVASLLTVMSFAEPVESAVVSGPTRLAAKSERRIWVFLSDKGPDALARVSAMRLPERAAARIALRGSTVNPMTDLPVFSSYREQLQDAGMVVKNEIRWLNAVTGWIHPDELEAVASLPFVDSLRPVATFVRTLPDEIEYAPGLPKTSSTADDVFDYGPSATQQITLIGVNHLHRAGLTGRGVRVGFMDTGFSLGIRAFNCTTILGTRDFINGDEDVGDNEAGQMRHGTQTLSLCGAFDEGELIGVAPASEYVVAKTELVNSEIEAEEDNWVAGLEWLDSMGCDIVSSSLGYADWYTDDDFDGNTAPSTIAADLAAARGVLVVNAAGNEGCGDGDIRLIVPADGDSVLAVGASTLAGEWAQFSSCGPTSDGRIKPDVIAPGAGVWTALPNTGFYQPGNGTSFATPIVAGVCALLLEQTPALTPWQLIDLLRSTADRASKPLVTYGWGLIQAVDAAVINPDTITASRQFDCERVSGQVVVWPNPAHDRTVIDFEGGTQSDGVFRVYTVTGSLVHEGIIAAGRGEWNGETASGKTAVPAVYLVHVVTENVSEVIKLAWLPHN